MKNRGQRSKHQHGSILTLVLLGLLAAAALATIAYGSYFQITRGNQDTAMRTQSGALLTQAAYTLATEASDTDSDGVAEPLAGLVTLADGWEIPSTSGAPKADAWGATLKYCPFDNGSTNSSVGRLTGDSGSTQSAIQFVLVSAGPDKTFDTTCIQARTGAMGDDGVRSMSVAQLNQGVGGTYFYGDPVTNVTALPASDSPAGKLRVAQDTQIPYLWNGGAWQPLNSGAWLVITAGASCTGFPAGTLGRDAADELYLCTTLTQVWKRVQGPP
jgi:type II secretory pathway pseudopilin PulG